MEDGIGKAYMRWRDVAEEFSCDRSKAMLSELEARPLAEIIQEPDEGVEWWSTA